MKIHRILTHVCLHYYFCYAKTSSPAVQKNHSKVYGNPIPPSLYSILLAWEGLTLICISLARKCMLSANWCATMSKDGHVSFFHIVLFFNRSKKLILFDLKILIYFPSIPLVFSLNHLHLFSRIARSIKLFVQKKR